MNAVIRFPQGRLSLVVTAFSDVFISEQTFELYEKKNRSKSGLRTRKSINKAWAELETLASKMSEYEWLNGRELKKL